MIDSHCHIDLYPNPLSIARQAEKLELKTIAVTNLPSYFILAREHLSGFRFVKPSLGFHPIYAANHIHELLLFKKCLLPGTLIGEIGLDYSSEGRITKEQQLQVFRFILDLIRGSNRFLSIHSRGAEKQVLELLDEYSILNAVFHWYSGSLEVLKMAIQRGHYFSINTAMISSQRSNIILAHIPPYRVLTESDGPHVSLGRSPVKPWDVINVNIKLGELWGWDLERVDKQISDNFNKVASTQE